MGIIEAIKYITREEALEEGMEKGSEKKSYEVVKNFLLNTDFSNQKIASLAGVSETFVKKVKKELNK